MLPTYYFSIDLGATSGRTIIARYDGGRVEMRELTRFETTQIHRNGHIFWDLPKLYDDILLALHKVKAEGICLTSIGIDTWGCDVAFFDKDGELIGLPYCYRDPHTDGAMERYFAECMPKEELYRQTARLLGFTRRGARTDAAVQQAIELLEVMERITVNNDIITLKS